MSEKVKGCQSHACYIKPPKGQGVNGPCMCTKIDLRRALLQTRREAIEEAIETIKNDIYEFQSTHLIASEYYIEKLQALKEKE